MTETWTEADSELYRRLAPIAVPNRAEQIATLLTLVPYATNDTFRIVELASGEGLLATALLTAFPHAQYTGLDGSDSMRAATKQRLAAFADRATIAAFDLASTDWYPHAEGAGLIISSLAVHHLPEAGKRTLFHALCQRLDPRRSPATRGPRRARARRGRRCIRRKLGQSSGGTPGATSARRQSTRRCLPCSAVEP